MKYAFHQQRYGVLRSKPKRMEDRFILSNKYSASLEKRKMGGRKGEGKENHFHQTIYQIKYIAMLVLGKRRTQRNLSTPSVSRLLLQILPAPNVNPYCTMESINTDSFRGLMTFCWKTQTCFSQICDLQEFHVCQYIGDHAIDHSSKLPVHSIYLPRLIETKEY